MNLYKLHEILQTHDISIEEKEGFFVIITQKNRNFENYKKK